MIIINLDCGERCMEINNVIMWKSEVVACAFSHNIKTLAWSYGTTLVFFLLLYVIIRLRPVFVCECRQQLVFWQSSQRCVSFLQCSKNNLLLDPEIKVCSEPTSTQIFDGLLKVHLCIFIIGCSVYDDPVPDVSTMTALSCAATRPRKWLWLRAVFTDLAELCFSCLNNRKKYSKGLTQDSREETGLCWSLIRDGLSERVLVVKSFFRNRNRQKKA